MRNAGHGACRRAAVAVVADTPDAQALLAAELSKDDRVTVVERDALVRLMGERTRQALKQSEGGGVEHLPEPVDFFCDSTRRQKARTRSRSWAAPAATSSVREWSPRYCLTMRGTGS